MLEAKNLEKQILIKKIDNRTLNIKIFDNKMLMAILERKKDISFRRFFPQSAPSSIL